MVEEQNKSYVFFGALALIAVILLGFGVLTSSDKSADNEVAVPTGYAGVTTQLAQASGGDYLIIKIDPAKVEGWSKPVPAGSPIIPMLNLTQQGCNLNNGWGKCMFTIPLCEPLPVDFVEVEYKPQDPPVEKVDHKYDDYIRNKLTDCMGKLLVIVDRKTVANPAVLIHNPIEVKIKIPSSLPKGKYQLDITTPVGYPFQWPQAYYTIDIV